MNLKEQAAAKALQYVKSGMVVGLGTGSTTRFFVELLAAALQKGELKNIIGIPTSEQTFQLASQLAIPLSTLDEHDILDLAVDGADEVDADLNLIKGRGRALFREKIIEIHAKKFVVIVDELKLVARLGMRGFLPVEIVPFAVRAQVGWLQSLNCRAELWLEENGKPAVTDNGNYLVKCFFEGGIDYPLDLGIKLKNRTGVVEHGLFLKMASIAVVAGKDGLRVIARGLK